MAGSSGTRRQALYFPADMLRELQEQGARQDRSLSWLIQQAWRIARGQMQRIPGSNDQPGDDDPREQPRQR